MKKFITALFFIASQLNAQQVDPVLLEENRILEQKFKEKFEQNRLKAEEIAKQHSIELVKKLPDGRKIEFETFDQNGQMLFRTTDNVGAGRTISANKVWPGGSAGTSLTGIVAGNRLGVWDGGGVLLTHQEFGGRVVQVDGATSDDDHATHVAGTMVGGGFQANARGMSYQANLRAYDWSNDESEMSAAGAGGMLVSNHSYGTICGWYNDGSNWYWYGDPSISATTDYKFGFYDQQAVEWDNIAFNNPFMLICKSAGNDRGQTYSGSHLVLSGFNWVTSSASRGADGGAAGFDCISTYGTAKNILTVGAVNKINNSNSNNGWTQTSDVVMSSFSGWGPTDDGRIKPDVVGCGVSVYSPTAGSNSTYSTYNGTSMATPNVSGSLLLVQQHFNNLKNRFMRSATLKALVIHTADEAGNIGPDYKFGWGLVNTAKAVQLITDSNSNMILEPTLNNAGTYTQNINVGGSTTLKVTIVWHERAGTPTSPQLNPTTSMLVNDLDLRLRRVSDNTLFQPYILDPANPNNQATTGDNTRDNVEQIVVTAPQAGTYTITVNHKGTLRNGAAQPFSIIISGVVGIPVANFTANNTVICSNQSVSFTDLSSGSPTTRRWYFPGGSPATSTNATQNVSYATPGRYPVALAISNAFGADSIYQTQYITVGGLTLPFSENFESNSPTLNRWVINNSNNDTTWRLAQVGGSPAGNQVYCMPFYNYVNTARRDQLSSPPLSFRGHTAPVLTFSYAHALYTGNTLNDSLVVWISTNCGTSYTRLASYGGASLATAPSSVDEFIPTQSSDWCSTNCKSIPLNAYAGMNNIRIRFESYNNYGNNLYIDNVNITGTPLPPLARFSASKRNVCTNELINFSDTSRNFPNAWRWTFDGANIATSTDQNPTISYTAPGLYAVKLVVTNAAGSDSLTQVDYITVTQGPAVPNIISTLSNLCDGDTATMNTDSTADSYQWFRNGLAMNGATTNTITTAESGSYRIRLIATNGCTTQSTAINLTSSSKPGIPVVTSTLSGSVMCTGGTAILTSSALSGNQWYRNGQILAGQTNRQLTITDSGSYTVTVTEGGCASDFSAARIVNLLPQPATSEITGPSVATSGNTETYSVTPTSGSSYNWIVSGGTRTGGGNTATVTIQWGTASAGVVQVQETAQNGCKGELKQLNVALNRVGLEDVSLLNGIQVYPIPAHSLLTLSSAQPVYENIAVKLYNTLGQLVVDTDWLMKGVNEEKQIDISKLKSGVYLLELTTSNVRSVKRIQVN